jgi:hypothetical protein
VNHDLAFLVVDLEQNSGPAPEADRPQTGPQIVAPRTSFRHGRETEAIGFDAFNKTKGGRLTCAPGDVFTNSEKVCFGLVTDDDRPGYRLPPYLARLT